MLVYTRDVGSIPTVNAACGLMGVCTILAILPFTTSSTDSFSRLLRYWRLSCVVLFTLSKKLVQPLRPKRFNNSNSLASSTLLRSLC